MKSAAAIAKDYIGSDYAKVPYLFSNLSAWSENNPNIKIWVEKDLDNNIIALMLLYYTCLHFYSKEKRYSGTKLNEILNSYNIDVVMLPESQLQLTANFPLESWNIISDYILIHEKAILSPNFSSYMLSSQEEIYEIADLMMTDSLYSEIYSLDNLVQQLTNRWKDGFGKIFCYKINGKIVGSTAITSENEDFITNGCLIVDKNYRRMGIGEELVKAVASYSFHNQKDCLCFIGVDNKASYSMHKKCENITEIGKIIKCIKK